MSRENIEVDPEHDEQKHGEEQSTVIADEGEDVESLEVEGDDKEKTLDELKEENKDF